MRVWILIPDYWDSYEGYGEPEGVYATEAAAKKAQAEQAKIHSAPRAILSMLVERPRKKKRK